MAHGAVSWLQTFTPMLDMDSPPEELRRSEDTLEPVPVETDDPLELLEALEWGRHRAFFARFGLSRTVSLWHENAFGIPT